MIITPQEKFDIQKILEFIVKQEINEGITYRQDFFDIEGDGSKYREEILSEYGWNEKYLYKLVKTAISLGLIEHKKMCEDLYGLQLTKSGFDLVLPKNEKESKQHFDFSHSIFNGQSQFGNNNIQNIQQDFYKTVIQRIEEMDASVADKEKAKSL